MNLAVFILILMYIGICSVVVGYWAFGTISKQEKSIQDKLDINIKRVLRMKANLYTNQGKQINHQRHIDIKDLDHTVALFSVNDNNGFTMVGDKKIVSKANRMIVFDGSIEHCSNTQTDTDVRININMDLI